MADPESADEIAADGEGEGGGASRAPAHGERVVRAVEVDLPGLAWDAVQLRARSSGPQKDVDHAGSIVETFRVDGFEDFAHLLGRAGVAGSCRMIDEFAKDNLHGRLRRDRKALLWKLDGLSEYDARRPLTVTGTNLLGLVKHVASVEARYFGEVFDRPFPEPLSRWQDHDGSDLWAAEDEARDQIIEFYRRTWEHSDATIDELALDTPGHVPWWPEPYPNTNLFAVLVHILGETNRHAGHADILREGVDGRTGMRPEHEMNIDEDARTAYCAKIEQAARSAASVKFEQHDAGREC